MRSIRSILTVLAYAIVVTSVVSAGVAAQGTPNVLLLNQGTQQIGTVSLDGQTYQVHRYQNSLPYASGISVYANGQEITADAQVRDVLTALAQKRAVRKLGPADVTALQTAKRNVSTSAAAVSEAAAALNHTLVYRPELKTTRVDGTTVWNASIRAAPQLREFNETAREMRPKLRTFQNNSDAFTENATALVTLIEQRQNGTVDSHRLYDQYSRTLAAKDEIAEQLDFSGIGDGLAELARTSHAIAGNVSTVPEKGDEIARRFATVHNETSVAANRTRALELPGSEFEETQETAENLEETWMEQWHSRRNAATEIYATVIGVPVGLGVVGSFVLWRRDLIG